MTRIVGIIPARMGSSRFPGKPLAPILGRPMIEHVYRAAESCGQLQAVCVATCDFEIKTVVEGFGGKVIMTSPSHERATDRVAQAAENLEGDIVVMIQGDEPMITAGMIEASLAPLANDCSVDCVNLIRQITSEEEYLDPNTIKVVADAFDNALYFSRAPIPGGEFKGDSVVFKQVCVIPFRRSLLRDFVRLPQSPLEQAESIDMLRLIENGYRVRLVKTEVNTHAVDTPDDLLLVEELMRNSLECGGRAPVSYRNEVTPRDTKAVPGHRTRKSRVLITAPYFLEVLEIYRDRLEREGIEIIVAPVRERLTEEELLDLVEEVDGVVCGDDAFTARVLHAAKKLKVISKWGTGIDSIDTKAAAALGISVCNTPNAFTDSVADSTLGYILSFARKLHPMDHAIRLGTWQKSPATALRECSLGVVGVGNIGRAVVRRARAFGMNTFGNDPIPPDESFRRETQLEMISLSDLLEKSDFVTLHCDLNPTSFHLIGQRQLALMRPGTHLINTARGSLIDEAALIEALQERRIAGAALDVFEVEPLPLNSPLRTMDNCLLAPHNANSDSAAHKRVHESTIANLLAGLRS